jgi:hypothetical protein
VSLKSRLRRLDAGVHWLETKGVARRKWLATIRRHFADRRTDDRGTVAGRKNKSVPPSAPKPIVASGTPPPKVVALPPPQAPPVIEARPQAMPGQPVALPSPDMEIRPTRWRPRGAQDYDEEERPGTNGRCITEYDPLRDEDDDDEP